MIKGILFDTRNFFFQKTISGQNEASSFNFDGPIIDNEALI